jgi:hypothetical protein
VRGTQCDRQPLCAEGRARGTLHSRGEHIQLILPPCAKRTKELGLVAQSQSGRSRTGWSGRGRWLRGGPDGGSFAARKIKGKDDSARAGRWQKPTEE